MIHRVRATYRDGKLIPEHALPLSDESVVEITIDAPTVIPPTAQDPEERRRRLEELVARMQAHPLPENAPKFTRDQLHERR
jgi:hypothetical protein